MYQVSQSFKDRFCADNRDIDIWVKFNDLSNSFIDDWISENIVADSFNMSQSIGSVDEFKLGVANSTSIEFEAGRDKPFRNEYGIDLNNDNLKGQEIEVYLIQKIVDGDGKPITITTEKGTMSYIDMTKGMEYPVVILDYGEMKLKKGNYIEFNDVRTEQTAPLLNQAIATKNGSFNIRRIVPFYLPGRGNGYLTRSGTATAYLAEAILMGKYKIDESPVTSNKHTRKIVAYDKLYSMNLDREVTYKEGTTLAIGDLANLAAEETGIDFGDVDKQKLAKSFAFSEYPIEQRETQEFTFEDSELGTSVSIVLKKSKIHCLDCNPENKHVVDWIPDAANSVVKRLKDALGITALLNINNKYYTDLYNDSSIATLERAPKEYLNAQPVWKGDGTGDIWRLSHAVSNGKELTVYDGTWWSWGGGGTFRVEPGAITANRLGWYDVDRPGSQFSFRMYGYFEQFIDAGINGTKNGKFFHAESILGGTFDILELRKNSRANIVIGSPRVHIVAQVIDGNNNVVREMEVNSTSYPRTSDYNWVTVRRSDLKEYMKRCLANSYYEAGIATELDEDYIPSFINYDEQESYYEAEKRLTDYIDSWENVDGLVSQNFTLYCNWWTGQFSRVKNPVDNFHFEFHNDRFELSDDGSYWQLFPIGIVMANPVLMTGDYSKRAISFDDMYDTGHIDDIWWGADNEISTLWEYQFRNNLFNSYIQADSDLSFTVREIIQAICEIQGKSFAVNRYGEFEAFDYENKTLFPEVYLYPSQDLYPERSNYEYVESADIKELTVYEFANSLRYKQIRMYTVNGWEKDRLRRQSGSEVYDINNIITENFALSEYQKNEIYQNVWNAIHDIQFNSVEIKMQGHPWIDTGDIIEAKVGGTDISTFIVERSYSGIQIHEDSISQVY